MKEAQVQSRFLEDHARLRGKAEVLESLALRILRGDDDLGSALRLKGEEMLEHLVRHMEWEERELVPLLERSGRSDLSTALASEHAAQRTRFEADLRTLQGAERRPLALARHLLEFVRWLENDMQAEEANVVTVLAGLAAKDTGSDAGKRA